MQCIFSFFQGNVPPLKRTALEVLSLLRPTAQLSSMWFFLLGNLLKYLPKPNSSLVNNEDDSELTESKSHISGMRRIAK